MRLVCLGYNNNNEVCVLVINRYWFISVCCFVGLLLGVNLGCLVVLKNKVIIYVIIDDIGYCYFDVQVLVLFNEVMFFILFYILQGEVLVYCVYS